MKNGTMKKLIKIFFSIIVVAIVFIIAAVGIFVATFDADDYKNDLSTLVAEETGRNLQFFGDVSLTIYPALGLDLGALSFSNAEGFSKTPMVKVNQVSISIDVPSLFAFKPEVDKLILDSLEINLEKNTAGVTNWDDLTAQSSSSAETGAGESSSSDTSSDGTPMKIEGAFGGLDISNAKLTFKDDQAGTEYRLNRLDISTGRITPDEAFPFKLDASVTSVNEVDASIELAADIFYQIESGVINLNDLVLALSAVGPLLPTEDLKVDISAQKLRFNPASSVLDLDSLSLTTDAAGDIFPLGKIKAEISGETLKLALNKNSLSIEGLALAIDEARLTGRLDVKDYLQPDIAFELASDNLDVDALLGTPPPTPPGDGAEAEAAPEAVETGSAEDVKIELPTELLREIGLDGSLKIAKLKIQNLHINDVDVGIKAGKGKIEMSPLTMKMYDGGFSGKVGIDVTGKQPSYAVSKAFDRVQIGPLMVDFAALDKIGGALTASVDVNTRGEWLSELKKNSQGNMSLNFADGALKGFNLRHMLDTAKAKIKGDAAPDAESRVTDFSALSLSGKIRDGVFSSDDLNLQAPVIRVGGEGQADLNVNTVDYLVNAKLVGTTKGQQGGDLDDLTGLLIPVKIVGPFASPDIDIQLDEMLKAKAAQLLSVDKEKLAKEVAEQKAALKKKLDEEKAKLAEAKRKAAEKEKAVIEARKAAEKKKLEEEKARLEAELKAKKKAEKEKAKEELLKKLGG